MFKKKSTIKYLLKTLSIVLGLVLVWRGIWYVMDGIDYIIFGESNQWTALGGIIIGLIILYLPNKDLQAIEKL